jgi:hypothetical protein
MSPEEILASAHLHRSPLLVRCMQDHLAGRRYPLELLSTDPSVYQSVNQSANQSINRA